MKGTITVLADIIITEIMYNPPERGTDVYEYIELYNNGNTSVNLKNYRFIEGVSFILSRSKFRCWRLSYPCGKPASYGTGFWFD